MGRCHISRCHILEVYCELIEKKLNDIVTFNNIIKRVFDSRFFSWNVSRKVLAVFRKITNRVYYIYIQWNLLLPLLLFVLCVNVCSYHNCYLRVFPYTTDDCDVRSWFLHVFFFLSKSYVSSLVAIYVMRNNNNRTAPR